MEKNNLQKMNNTILGKSTGKDILYEGKTDQQNYQFK